MADRRFSVRHLPGVSGIALITFVVLYTPVLILVIYAFNAGPVIGRWEGFSLRWFTAALENAAFRNAARNSLIVASVAGLVATLCATLAALATTRGRRFRGEGGIYLVLNQPLLVPEIVLAVALMILLAQIKQATGYHGLGWLIIAHSTFCIPFAYMPIRARLEGMDLTLETAAMDLYASRFYTFRRVTLPLMAPGVLAGFMLAFVISLDNVVVSTFVKSPGQETLPTYLMGELRRNLSSEIYAISALLLFASVAVVAASWLITRRKP
ncbi:ABC transporter permease [Natronohydrobacter thiooxidans]|uniref:ABC transporter permease n=1 Tax=Natronohydrobacter thiooxidans TaxID=87172 RepID=UPI0008FF2AFC|nr:ABC transporter permease [Natronohydrobacter thiooxidans]